MTERSQNVGDVTNERIPPAWQFVSWVSRATGAILVLLYCTVFATFCIGLPLVGPRSGLTLMVLAKGGFGVWLGVLLLMEARPLVLRIVAVLAWLALIAVPELIFLLGYSQRHGGGWGFFGAVVILTCLVLSGMIAHARVLICRLRNMRWHRALFPGGSLRLLVFCTIPVVLILGAYIWGHVRHGRMQQVGLLRATSSTEKVDVVLSELDSKPYLIEQRNWRGRTILHMAAVDGDVRLIDALIGRGAEIDVRDSDGNTPLHLAASYGAAEAVKALIDAGADVAARKGNYGKTPLHEAAQKGSVATIEQLLSAGARVTHQDDLEKTPLHETAWWDRPEAAECLAEHGADLDAPDCSGQTPLHVAADRNSVAVLRTLLRLGANPEALDDDGWTPLQLAAAQDHRESVDALLEGGARLDLVSAAARGDGAAVQDFVNQGADPGTPHPAGYTALHMAARFGHEEIVEALLKGGAPVNAQAEGNLGSSYWATNLEQEDHYRMGHYGGGRAVTPLHEAAALGSPEILGLLIQHGASLDARDQGEMTALHWAVILGREEAVACLLEAGASVHLEEARGRTPLDWAELKGDDGITEMLRWCATGGEEARSLQWPLLRNCHGNGKDVNEPLICADVRGLRRRRTEPQEPVLTGGRGREPLGVCRLVHQCKSA